MEHKPYGTDLRAPATDMRAPSTIPPTARPRDTKIWPWIAGSILVFGLIIFGVSRTASDYNYMAPSNPATEVAPTNGATTPDTGSTNTLPNSGSPQTIP